MDPNSILQIIDDALDDEDAQPEAKDLAEDLRRWISFGGFAPEWDAFPKAAAFYNNHVRNHPGR